MNITEKRKIEQLVQRQADKIREELIVKAAAEYKKLTEVDEVPSKKVKAAQARLAKHFETMNRAIERAEKANEALAEEGWEFNGRFPYKIDTRHSQRNQFIRPMYKHSAWYVEKVFSYDRVKNNRLVLLPISRFREVAKQHPQFKDLLTKLADNLEAIDNFVEETALVSLYLSEGNGVDLYEKLVEQMALLIV